MSLKWQIKKTETEMEANQDILLFQVIVNSVYRASDKLY